MTHVPAKSASLVTSLTDSEFHVLDALRVYRFLTTDQFIRLGIATKKQNISRALLGLMRASKPKVAFVDHGLLPGVGRLPRLHYLTEHGAELVAQIVQCDPKAVFYPHGVVSVRHDLLHRIHCVDVEISVRHWAEANANMVNFYLHYFVYKGANRGKADSRRHSVVRIEVADRDAIIPDAVFRLQDHEGHERLFALEMFNQYRTKRMAEKVAEYRYAIDQMAEQFGYAGQPRILIILEDERALTLTQNRLSHDPHFGAEFWPFFFFHTLDGIQRDFRHGWRKIADTRSHALF